MDATRKTHQKVVYFAFVRFQLADYAYLYASILYS